MKCKGGWRVGHCIARKLQRVARNSNATQDVREGKKNKIQRADTKSKFLPFSSTLIHLISVNSSF